MSKGGKLLIFSAPSGSGKTTIVRYLLAQPELNLAFSVSATSRPRRGKEKNGEHYYFMSISQFKMHIKNDDFLEWEEVYRDNFYGTLKSEVERLWEEGKNVIFDIDVAGGLRIKKKYPQETLAVFVKPPSVDELKIRLKKRSTESDDKINMRIAKASVELATAPQFDVVMKNYDLDIALQEAHGLVADFVGVSKSAGGKMKKVGLYFGTFNPIHVGHLVIANHMVEFSDLDEVWFVITPQSPFKQKKTLLDNHHRYQMVFEATTDYSKLKPSKIEFDLPQPNYTVNTLVHLEEKYPQGHHFCLIMGEDNLKGFHKWKNYEVILERYDLYVYPRISEGKIEHQFTDHPKVHRVAAPIMEISSTFIRKQHALGKNIRPLLPAKVWEYLDEMNFYK